MRRLLSLLLPFVLLAISAAAAGELPRSTVFVTLGEPATVAVYRRVLDAGGNMADATAAAIAQLELNRAASSRLRDVLARSGLDAPEAFAMQRLANGVAVVAESTDLEALRALPGVRAVRPVALLHKDNRFSVGYIGATAAWGGEVPLTGEGLRIGVIDTGIDYLHADFGGPGAAADYEADDPEVVEDGSFPTIKVAGGWDFAGSEYGYSQEEGVPDSLVPVPDPDPMDMDSHGTHVAGTVAGYGVDGDGATWGGPWDLSLDLHTFRIGPGMAPEASLFALKVFGDSKAATASALTTAALEWAVDPDGDGDFADRLDVINISLGTDYGISGGYEVEVYANAVAAGLVIVAAAGNAWDIQFITSDPCAAEGVICVASCHHDGAPYPGLRVEEPVDLQGIYLARPSNFGPELSSEEDLTGALVLADPSLACAPLANADPIAGNIALIDRGDCKYHEKVLAAQEAGAIAAIVVNHQGGIPPKMTWDGEDVLIPSVIMRQVDGDALKAALAGETPVVVTLRKGLTAFVDDKVGQLAGSSSRGPTRQGKRIWLKPDLTAPGVDITSANARSGDGARSATGTSMASPAAAGILALLRQARPAWSPAEIKAWAMSTAAPDVIRSDGKPPLSTTRQGAGRIDAVRALGTEAFAYDADHPLRVGLSFDALDVPAPMEEDRTVRVENRSEVPRTFTVTYESAVDLPGAGILLPDGGELTVPANGTADLAVTLAADPGALRHVRDPNLETTAGKDKLPRVWFAEETGHLVFREGDEPVLRVPVLAGPRPASDMHTTATEVTFRGFSGVGTLPLAGSDLAPEGPGPEAVRSLVTPFELKVESPDEAIGNATYVTEGFPSEEVQATINAADLRAVGITSDYYAQVRAGAGITETTLYLALATWGTWGTPVEVFFAVEYDLDGDHAADGYFFNSHNADAFFVNQAKWGAADPVRLGAINHLSPHRVTIPIHMSDVLVLPLPASALGLTLQDPLVALRVTSYHVHHHGQYTMVDTTDWFHHDPTRQVFDFLAGGTGMPVFPDRNSAGIDYVWNVDGIHSPGLMLVHHHNPVGARLDLLEVHGPGCWRAEDCAEGTVCVLVAGHCMDCFSAADCGGGQYCALHSCIDDCAHAEANPCAEELTCDLQTGRCGECVYNDQCPAGAWCDPETLRCVTCTQSWECGDGEWCDPVPGACAADCRVEGANPCPADRPWCNPGNGGCAACLFHAHCNGGTICDTNIWTCVEPPWEPAQDTVSAPDTPDTQDSDAAVVPPSCPGGGCTTGAPAPAWPLLFLLLLLRTIRV